MTKTKAVLETELAEAYTKLERIAEEPKTGIFGNEITETIYESITKVSAGIGAISKNKQADMGKFTYQFRGIDDVLDALHPVLIACGVTITPQVVDVVQIQDGVLLTIDYLIANRHGETEVATFVGEGRSNSDKAAQIAQSNAYKYMAFQTFCIPVAVDDSDSVQYVKQEHTTTPNEATPQAVLSQEDLLLKQVKDHAWLLTKDVEPESYRIEETKMLIEQELAVYGANPKDSADAQAIMANMDAIYDDKAEVEAELSG